MRLIDMEKALSELCLSHKDIIYIDKNETAERIRKIPSIDIVRCKECKHYKILEAVYDCEMGLPNVAINDFCSYGVKKGADDERGFNQEV